MDLQKMIAELEAERDRLDHAILALERLSAGKLGRRGRPPKWLKDEMDRQAKFASDDSSNGQPGKSKKA